MDKNVETPVPTHGERAAIARRRVSELQQRRNELAAGVRPREDDLALAEQRVDDARCRAQAAHLAAAQRHEEAARVHERAANNLQAAAMTSPDEANRLQDQADEHWQAAQDSHLHGVRERAQAADPEQSSSEGS